MSPASKGSHVPSHVQIAYQLIRNTTSPDEVKSGVKSFVVNLPAHEILKLGTEGNLREYIAEYNPRRRNRVHDAIRGTIESYPDRFITRNSGFVIAATDIEVDDNKKIAKLKEASIINGAQSQGEIRAWMTETFGDFDPDELEEPPFYVRAEIIVDPDQQQIVETAIARNTATPVKSISQAFARGHLTDLIQSVAAEIPGITLRQSETDEDVFETRKVIQLARLLMPSSVSQNSSSAEKLRPYKNPEQCLTDFSDWYERKDSNPEALEKYSFIIQIAPAALKEYEYWERHEAWNGNNIWEETKKGGRACRRDPKSKKICWISPGIIFPVVGAMSEFVERDASGKWHINKPAFFKPEEHIERAVAQFRAINCDPMLMGRSEAAYDALRIYPSTLVGVMKLLSQAK